MFPVSEKNTFYDGLTLSLLSYLPELFEDLLFVFENGSGVKYFDINEANIRHKVKHTKVKVDHHRHRHRHSSTSIEINVTLSRHVPLALACKFRLHLLYALAINIFPVFASKI